jgi:hypothetical protein
MDLVAKRHTLCYDMSVKYFSWSKKKNDLLRSEREISFEDVVFHIETGFLLDVLDLQTRNDAEGFLSFRSMIMSIWSFSKTTVKYSRKRSFPAARQPGST